MWISSESKLQNLIMRSGTIMMMETESRESKRRASDEEESAATVGKVILISSFRAQLFYGCLLALNRLSLVGPLGID
jgi:hypothetical protein